MASFTSDAQLAASSCLRKIQAAQAQHEEELQQKFADTLEKQMAHASSEKSKLILSHLLSGNAMLFCLKKLYFKYMC